MKAVHAVKEDLPGAERVGDDPKSDSPRTRAAALFGCALTLAAGTIDLSMARVHPPTALAGTTLLATAVSLARRRRWALYVIGFLASLSVLLHFIHAEEAMPFNYALALLGTAVFLRQVFCLPSRWTLDTNVVEQGRARLVASRFGDTVQDFFKTLPDKSLFFTADGSAFVGYRVSHNFAIALGDPVGPPEEIENAIREFMQFCRIRGWNPAFHQTGPEHLAIYESLGLRRMKVGEDAIADLTTFTTLGPRMKEIRKSMNRLDRAGFRFQAFPAGAPAHVIAEARSISDEWLHLPGRRERRFTLGQFSEDYLSQTPFFMAFDSAGRAVAFVNLAPSNSPSVAGMDLLRRRAQAPNGIVDYLFVHAFSDLKARGYTQVNLGLAPLCGFAPGERSHWEERFVHRFLKHFSRILNFEGLRTFKAKYASLWQPRYIVYPSALSLPLLGLALRGATEIDARR